MTCFAQNGLRKTRALPAQFHIFLLFFCANTVHNPRHEYPRFRHSYHGIRHGFPRILHRYVSRNAVSLRKYPHKIYNFLELLKQVSFLRITDRAPLINSFNYLNLLHEILLESCAHSNALSSSIDYTASFGFPNIFVMIHAR